MELVSCLLPHGSPVHLEAWHLNEATAQLTLRVTSTQALVHCPICRFPTRRIHSHYRRTLADLPWAHVRVVLQLGVRQFFCANGRCTRRIFTERLPQLVAPWARRTIQLAQRLVALGVALGGTASEGEVFHKALICIAFALDIILDSPLTSQAASGSALCGSSVSSCHAGTAGQGAPPSARRSRVGRPRQEAGAGERGRRRRGRRQPREPPSQRRHWPGARSARAGAGGWPHRCASGGASAARWS
jgi:zinc-finger of transposase IS204/IS1001/IS1096/IS1165